jgi:hypothetical protein
MAKGAGRVKSKKMGIEDTKPDANAEEVRFVVTDEIRSKAAAAVALKNAPKRVKKEKKEPGEEGDVDEFDALIDGVKKEKKTAVKKEPKEPKEKKPRVKKEKADGMKQPKLTFKKKGVCFFNFVDR